MKIYIIKNIYWEQTEILYCGFDEQKAKDIKNNHDRPQDNYIEIWENEKRLFVS
jgi:Zn ribbon nucleic-acid-binding protein